MKTLADDAEVARQYMVHKRQPFRSTSTVRAPCCGRKVAADMVEDWRDVPGTVMRAGGRHPPADLNWACDGCRDRLVKTPGNGWTRDKLGRARGAPSGS